MKRKIYTLMFTAAGFFALTSCGDEDVSEVKLSSEAVTLFTGETLSLTAEVLPADADNKNIDWSSSNEAVVTVDAQGNLAAVAPGVATVTAKAQDNGRQAICEVTVKNGFVFDTERKEIVEGAYGDYTNGPTGDGFRFWFYTNEEDDGAFESADEYVWIDIPNEMMGETFELTEEKLYDWGWWIVYEVKNPERYYFGFGEEGEMENVQSGTMRADVIGENKFRVVFDVKFTDGKTLKGAFTGELPADTGDSGGRKGGRTSRAGKGNS
jgi:hypothetical protein